MVQRRIYTVNVVKKPVKIQFFERFHWGTKARRMREQKHGTFPFLKRKNKLNMFLWNRFITCFNGPHSRHPAPYRESSIWLLLVIPAAITSFTGCLWVVFAHENRTKGGLFQEEPGHNCFWKIIEIHVVTKRFVYYLISVVRIVHATNIEISNRKLQKS